MNEDQISEAWSHYYEYGAMSEFLHECDEMDGCYIQQAFEDGFRDGKEDTHAEQYQTSEREFEGETSWGNKITEYRAYIDGANYRLEGFPKW